MFLPLIGHCQQNMVKCDHQFFSVSNFLGDCFSFSVPITVSYCLFFSYFAISFQLQLTEERLTVAKGLGGVLTFRVRRSRGEIYIGQVRLCVSVCPSPHSHTDPDVTWRNGTGCP